MAASTITSKGQVTIPKAVRDRLGLNQGDRLDFVVDEGGKLSVQVERSRDLDSLQGFLHHLAKPRPVSVEEMRSAIRKRAADRAQRASG